MSPLDVDTRVLRYFVAVADRLSFTRAARDLYVSQPALSRQIRQLEEDLGAELFVRTGREIRLTGAGGEMLPLARKVLDDWLETVRLVRSAAAAEANVLRVGFVASGGGSVARRARAAFSEQRPEVRIEPKRFDWGGEPDALRQGLVDVAFVWLPADISGLRSRVVATEPRYVALSRDHPLTARPSVGIADLRDEPLMWTRKAPKEWVDWWAVNPRPDGSEPVWGPENDNVEEMLEHVATGAAVCIGPESMAVYYAHPELAWRPIADIEPLRIAVAWVPETTSPVVRAFVEAAIRSAS
ncbi:LysR family transcriptional regulator [Saccharothrix deserti]|uniref:LysR family transcriptional regulator n=1 Tax=Saccharothrix deserti TaxID=2593674 RepID=UPI00192E517C|nr:LysR family transcriptional regulator [Saccharothrix deserti]